MDNFQKRSKNSYFVCFLCYRREQGNRGTEAKNQNRSKNQTAKHTPNPHCKAKSCGYLQAETAQARLISGYGHFKKFAGGRRKTSTAPIRICP